MKVHRPGVVLHLLKVFCEANLRRKLQGLGVWLERPRGMNLTGKEGKAITRLVGGSLRQ